MRMWLVNYLHLKIYLHVETPLLPQAYAAARRRAGPHMLKLVVTDKQLQWDDRCKSCQLQGCLAGQMCIHVTG